MRPKNFAFWLGSIAIAGLLGPASAAQPAPKSGTQPCLGFGFAIQPAAEAPTTSGTSAPDKHYDWKASFAAYPVPKAPWPPDANSDLPGTPDVALRTPIAPQGNGPAT